ncbi:hypothetical protein H072_6941 [Dactylellina haptotyla CBS 200.50]|uniref:Uncharacterized protein n=1 Tax=Dactylellina haptotyla (strain CBS 200.50) TaxID=1284197 RepID=S8BIY7_DACHA|nr:hypothetical protein H072_6941 [Dactylellina haptotyla CBS 200.50]
MTFSFTRSIFGTPMAIIVIYISTLLHGSNARFIRLTLSEYEDTLDVNPSTGKLFFHNIFKRYPVDIFDTNSAWMNNGCINIPTDNPDRVLSAAEYYAGPPINPFHPYFLTDIVIFSSLDCPEDDPAVASINIQLEEMNPQQLSPSLRPGWLLDPSAEYQSDLQIANTQEIIIPAGGLPDDYHNRASIPSDLKSTPHWLDFSDTEAYLSATNNRHIGLSAHRGQKYIEQLAEYYAAQEEEEKLQQGTQADWLRLLTQQRQQEEEEEEAEEERGPDTKNNYNPRIHVGNALWSVFLFSGKGSALKGNISVKFYSEFNYRHVRGLAKENDEYVADVEVMEGDNDVNFAWVEYENPSQLEPGVGSYAGSPGQEPGESQEWPAND